MADQTTVNEANFARATGGNSTLAGLISTINESSNLVNYLNTFTSYSGNTIAIGAPGSGTKTVGNANGSFTIYLDPGYWDPSAPANAQYIAIYLAHELGHAEMPGGLYSDYTPINPDQAKLDGATAEGIASLASSDVASDYNTYNQENGLYPGVTRSANNDPSLQYAINQAGPNYDDQVSAAGQVVGTRTPSNALGIHYTNYWEDAFELTLCDKSSALNQANLSNASINWQSVTPTNFTVTANADGSWTISANNISSMNGNLFNISGSEGANGSLTMCRVSSTNSLGGITDYLTGLNVADGGSNLSIVVDAAASASLTGSNDDITAGNDTLMIGGTGNAVTGDNMQVAMSAGAQAHVVGNGNTFTLSDKSSTELDVSGNNNSVSSNGNTIHVGSDSSVVAITGSGNTIEMLGSQQTVTTSLGNTVNVDSNLEGESILGGASVNAGDHDSLAVSGGMYNMVTAGVGTSLDVGSSQYGAMVTVGDNSNVTVESGGGMVQVAMSNGHLALEDGSSVTLQGSSNVIGAGDVASAYITGNGNTYSGDSGSVGVTGDNNTVTTKTDASEASSISGDGNNFSGTTGTLYVYSGAGNTVTMGAGASVVDEGNGNTLNLSGASATLMGSSGAVNGSGNSINVVSSTGPSTITGDNNSVGGMSSNVVVNVSGANNSLGGDGGIINLASGSSASVDIAEATINAASGVSLNVTGTSNVVVANGASVTFASNALDNTVNGSGNIISGANLSLTINNGGNTAAVTNSTVTFGGVSGDNLSVTGSGDHVTANVAGATVTYDGPHTGGTADIWLTGGSSSHLIADDTSVYFSNQNTTGYVTGDRDTIQGLADTIYLSSQSASQSANLALTNSTVFAGKGSFTLSQSGDTLHAADGSDIIASGSYGPNTVYVNNATIEVSDSETLNVIGSNNVITGGTQTSLTITGTGNKVQTTNSTIVFQGDNTGDTVVGAGDGGANWSAPDPDLPPGTNGGYTPPTTTTANVARMITGRSSAPDSSAGGLHARPDPNLLVHGLAAFMGHSDSGFAGHWIHGAAVEEHLHLALAS